MPKVTAKKWSEIYEALCTLGGRRRAFELPEELQNHLFNAERGLRKLRAASLGDWFAFCAGNNRAETVAIMDRARNLRSADRILDYFADQIDPELYPQQKEIDYAATRNSA